jgi:competence protein ComEC
MDWVSAPNIEHPALPQGRITLLSARLTALRARVEAFLEAERGQLPLWAIVAFGAGIALWFALPDPQQWSGLLFLAAGASLLGFTLVGGRVGAALGWFGLAIAAGCALVWWRSEQVATIRFEHPRIVELTAKVAKV